MNPVLYVVITENWDQMVCYKLRLFSETFCVYIKARSTLIYRDKAS